MSQPQIQIFRSGNGETRYSVSTPTNSKRLIFNADELSALGDQIRAVLAEPAMGDRLAAGSRHTVLGGTNLARLRA